MGVSLATVLPATANPPPQGLRIQLVVMEPGPSGTDAPHAPCQHNDSRELPPQLRELAPGNATEGEEATFAPLTFIY